MPRTTTKDRVALVLTDIEVYGSHRVDQLAAKATAADIDGDGADELLVATSQKELAAYDADGKRLWHHLYDGEIHDLAVADLDEDGKSEALCYLDTEKPEEPFFIYLHAMDPHAPYTPPDETLETFAPGFTRTEFQEVAGVEPSDIPGFAWMESGPVVDASLDALRSRQVVCVPGLGNRMLSLTARSLPRALVARVMGVAVERRLRSRR